MLWSHIKYFMDNCDFDMLITWLTTVDPVTVILNPYVLIPIIVIVGLTFYPATSEFGQNLVIYSPIGIYLFVTAVILKNDVISSIGPFLMGMTAFFMIAGLIIWHQFLKS